MPPTYLWPQYFPGLSSHPNENGVTQETQKGETPLLDKFQKSNEFWKLRDLLRSKKVTLDWLKEVIVEKYPDLAREVVAHPDKFDTLFA